MVSPVESYCAIYREVSIAIVERFGTIGVFLGEGGCLLR
jgi:hypothetical protein